MSKHSMVENHVRILEKNLGWRFSPEDFVKVKYSLANSALAACMDHDYATEAVEFLEAEQSNETDN